MIKFVLAEGPENDPPVRIETRLDDEGGVEVWAHRGGERRLVLDINTDGSLYRYRYRYRDDGLRDWGFKLDAGGKIRLALGG